MTITGEHIPEMGKVTAVYMTDIKSNSLKKLDGIKATASFFDESKTIFNMPVTFVNKAHHPETYKGIVAPFENWLNIIAGIPTIYFRTDKETLCFGLPYPIPMFQNPFRCSESVTGVLRFVCGTTEEENHLLGLS